MGEVYRARDTRLDRVVALKILSLPPPAAAAERRRRFEREARVIAGLSHPSICALYDIGREADTDYLVMEYIEGETLARRLSRRPLPVEQAIRIGIAVADALHYAHRRGVVHRDLKPGNVMLSSGGVKLLDFGLARLLTVEGAPKLEGAGSFAETLTEEGRVVGTVQYMAPEQLEEQPADSRTDIFALGAVLYEMTTGQKAFAGKSRGSLTAAILTATPRPIRELEPSAPASLDALVRGCLAKDPEQRWQDARDVALQLREIGSAREAAAPPRSRAVWRPFLFGAGVVAVLAAALMRIRPVPPAGERAPVAFSISPPARVPRHARPVQNSFALSPDGRLLVFAAPDRSGKSVLWVRDASTFDSVPLAGTEGAAAPFWSPDGRFVGFFADGKLKKVEISGGPPVAVCDARGAFFTGTWGSDGTILFAQLLGRAIERVSASGGTPVPVLATGRGREWSVCWPAYLPDSRHFLYVGRSELAGETSVRLGDAATGDSAPLLPRCSRAEFAPGRSGRPGDLLFVRDGTLLDQPFDAGRLRIAGEPRPLIAGVRQHAYTGLGAFSVSRAGALAFQSAGVDSRLVWRGRRGQSLGFLGDVNDDEQVRLSPSGRRVCVTRTDRQTGLRDLWIGDAATGALTRLTAASGDIFGATWSPREDELTYAAGTLRSAPRLCRIVVDGGSPVVLRPPGGIQTAADWSRDGRFIAYSDTSPGTNGDVWIYRLGDGTSFPFLHSADNEIQPEFSPDTRWLAFTSDASGKDEIYVAAFPGPGEMIRVSTAGGTLPRWRGDGKELFYVSEDSEMMAVPFRTRDGRAGEPNPLFVLRPSGWRDYDVTPDGRRFLVVENVGPPRSRFIQVVMNWRTIAPAK